MSTIQFETINIFNETILKQLDFLYCIYSHLHDIIFLQKLSLYFIKNSDKTNKAQVRINIMLKCE